MKELKFRLLRCDEIEVRPQSVKNGKATMLLYMNSRVVTDLLDETIGNMNWCSEFQSVDGKVICRIGIWDDDKKMFIYKSDTGSESNIEAEKGQFSDCYKRCLSRWGVNELYTAPNIVVDDDGYGNRGYYVSYIRYDESSRKISELHIKNKFDKEVFSWNFNSKPQEKQEPIDTNENYKKLKDFCSSKKGKVDITKLTEFFNYWSGRIKDFKGEINPEALWNKRYGEK